MAREALVRTWIMSSSQFKFLSIILLKVLNSKSKLDLSNFVKIVIIHLFKIKDAKTEVFRCLRCCIFEDQILFCIQSFA